MESPKARLLRRKIEVKSIQEVADSATFEVMADTALLQYVHDLPDTLREDEATANYHRIIGARDFLAKLSTIAEKAQVVTQTVSTANLNHKV